MKANVCTTSLFAIRLAGAFFARSNNQLSDAVSLAASAANVTSVVEEIPLRLHAIRFLAITAESAHAQNQHSIALRALTHAVSHFDTVYESIGIGRRDGRFTPLKAASLILQADDLRNKVGTAAAKFASTAENLDDRAHLYDIGAQLGRSYFYSALARESVPRPIGPQGPSRVKPPEDEKQKLLAENAAWRSAQGAIRRAAREARVPQPS